MADRAYYNEIDRDAVHVLRCLIADGLIAPGDVDDRSIKDVQPDDLAGYTQVHFFAGAGVWSVAARLAGWPDDRPLWTGSCPCQPFSAAGKGGGVDDPRHLWPDFFRLIRARRPSVVVGEQVAGSPGYGWFDGVASDLAGEGFASRTVDIPACAVDAPHIRQRLYWATVDVADTYGGGRHAARERGRLDEVPASSSFPERPAAERNPNGSLALVDAAGLGRGEGRAEPELRRGRAAAAGADASGDMAIPERCGREGRYPEGRGPGAAYASNSGHGRNGSAWAGAEWLTCHDGKARRTESGLRLLVDGMAGRVPAWRLGGNSINPVLAAEVIAALMDALDIERAAA